MAHNIVLVNKQATKLLELRSQQAGKPTQMENWRIRSFGSYVVGSKSFRPGIQKPRQMENAVTDI